MERAAKQQLSSQEWERVIEDFQSGRVGRERWVAQYPGLVLMELALHSILRKDSPLPLKTQLIFFLEENSHILVTNSKDDADPALSAVLDALRSLVQSPVDSASLTFSLKEQMMVCATSLSISLDALHSAPRRLESLADLLLTVINRPNHGLDRQTRSLACECLRQLESAYPFLLSDIVPHLWNLCQSERTHASQSYILLLTSVIHNLAVPSPSSAAAPPTISVLSTSLPLVPFSIPHSLLLPSLPTESRDPPGFNTKELRRVIAFLLEQPQVLTPCGMMEFLWMLLGIAAAMDLQSSLLKVQFSGLLFSYDPIPCHLALMLYSHFSDALSGEETEIARRLTLLSKQVQQSLVFRLLALHWLLGFKPIKKQSLVPMVQTFYPTVFDPLALKAIKLDVLAHCALYKDQTLKIDGVSGEDMATGPSVEKLFEDALVCVSAYQWLPPWSTETAMAFRTLHRFLSGGPRHSGLPSSLEILAKSTTFLTIQTMLVNMALEFCRLVPVIVAFVNRLLACSSHCFMGEHLLQAFDEDLLPKLAKDCRLAPYFPIFDKIAENKTVPPRRLLELLTAFVNDLVDKHGPDSRLRSWSQGSKVLGICHTMLMHHNSSRVFLPLSRLLAFTCQSFPDLEIRDNARIYLRMLLCTPGKKLRQILNIGEQLPAVSSSPHLSAFFDSHSPRPHDFNKSQDISSYIHLERVIPLCVKQAWSLAISGLGIKDDKLDCFEGIRDSEPPTGMDKEVEGSALQLASAEIKRLEMPLEPLHVASREIKRLEMPQEPGHVASGEFNRFEMPQEPLRVMDSKVAEIVEILRRHFSSIPDFRHMPGLKIQIPCTLRFESESFNRIWGDGKSETNLDGVDALPALYATVVTFSSSAPYGSIPSFRVPFLLGEPSQKDCEVAQNDFLAIVPIENGSGEVEESFKATVVIDLEPRKPVPGLINVTIEANAENGQIIRGPLQSITVGIEDIFLKAVVPSDVMEDLIPQYYSDLFDALWEACDNCSSTGRETFHLKGGRGVAAISGTKSVKLLEVPSYCLIGAVEQYLAPFVVCVVGRTLMDLVRDNGVIKDVIFKDELIDCMQDDALLLPSAEGSVLQLKYISNENDFDTQVDYRKTNMGCFHVLIFLPPRFHLLFQMEVSDMSTLVRIRTDHWPCLAYIDDYLESIFLT